MESCLLPYRLWGFPTHDHCTCSKVRKGGSSPPVDVIQPKSSSGRRGDTTVQGGKGGPSRRSTPVASKPSVDWSQYDRVIIEFCCYENSLMGKRTPASKSCYILRVTEQHDQTTEEGLRWLLDEIHKIPKDLPILLWGSIPCTGGSPWTRYNLRKYPQTFPARLRHLRAQWRKMVHNFYKVSEVICQRNGHWALEWPSKCEYWDSPFVKDFLRRQNGNVYEATACGCAFDLRAIAGPYRGYLMSKAWHIKSTMPNLAEFLDRPCHCSPDSIHAYAEGQNTAHSGRYTPEFVNSVHKMFSTFISNREN